MTEKDGDPTADFLAEVRAEETPWRTDRPAGEPAPEQPERPEKWRRTRSAGRVAAQAAPYVQAAAVAAWIASAAFGSSDDSGNDQSS